MIIMNYGHSSLSDPNKNDLGMKISLKTEPFSSQLEPRSGVWRTEFCL